MLLLERIWEDGLRLELITYKKQFCFHAEKESNRYNIFFDNDSREQKRSEIAALYLFRSRQKSMTGYRDRTSGLDEEV